MAKIKEARFRGDARYLVFEDEGWADIFERLYPSVEREKGERLFDAFLRRFLVEHGDVIVDEYGHVSAWKGSDLVEIESYAWGNDEEERVQEFFREVMGAEGVEIVYDDEEVQ